VRRRTKTWKPQ